MEFINNKIIEKIKESKENKNYYYSIYLHKNNKNFIEKIDICIINKDFYKKISVGQIIYLSKEKYIFEGLIRIKNKNSIILRKENNYYEFEITEEDNYFLKTIYNQIKDDKKEKLKIKFSNTENNK